MDENITGQDDRISKPKRFVFLTAALVAAVVFCLLLFTSARLPVVWDEGFVNERADLFPVWYLHVFNQVPLLQNLVPETPEYEAAREDESLSMLLSFWGINTYWPEAEEGHPYLPVYLAAVKNVTPSFLPRKIQVRFGAILFFSLAVGVVFYRLRSDFGTSTAVFSVASILLLPRVFAHVQVATWDSPLMAAWLLCWAFFPLALNSHGGAVFLGLSLGLACSSKFPGFTVILVIGLWLLLRLALDRTFFKGKRYVLLQRGGIVFVVAFLIFFFLNPVCWVAPVYGIEKFFRLNLNRDINVSILYLGRMYDLHHSLPWTNTMLWTAVTVPVGLLALFFIGLFALFKHNGKGNDKDTAEDIAENTVGNRDKRWPGLFLLLNFLALIVIRACPGTPVHDGVRLFVAAFPFLGIIAGFGAAWLWNVSGRVRTAARLSVAAVYLACVFNMFWYAPQWLSYYNVLIGGLPGAARAGMEPTYYWDGCDGSVLAWLNARTRPGERVAFGDWKGVDLAFHLYEDGPPESPHFQAVLRRNPLDIRSHSKDIRYYVLQRRPSSEFPQDTWLIRNVEPVFVKTIRKGGWGPWNLDSVPLIEIYDLEHIPERKE